jgi:hypothetical protein
LDVSARQATFGSTTNICQFQKQFSKTIVVSLKCCHDSLAGVFSDTV